MATVPEAIQEAREHHLAGRSRHAETIYRRILEQLPNHAGANHYLGTLMVQYNRPKDAIKHITRAIDNGANDVATFINLGEGYRLDQQFDKAVECYEKALELNPESVEALTNLSYARLAQGRLAEGIEAAEKVVRLKPDNARGHATLGYLCQSDGQTDRAMDCYRKALEIDPAAPDAARNYAAATKFKPGDPLVDAWERAVHRGNLQSQEAIGLHFALGKAYDDMADYDHAFEHYAQGNAIKRGLIDYSINYYRMVSDRFTAYFTPAFVERCRKIANDSSLPILVIGLPRSGTSLVEQILASHPQVHGAGEVKVFGDTLNELPHELPEFRSLPESLDDISDQRLRELADTYIDHLRGLDHCAKHVVDKHTIHYQLLAMFAGLLPNAKIIHIRRNPLDSCLSSYFQIFLEGQSFTYDLAETGDYYVQYMRLMDHWRRTIGVPMLEIDYEELVTKPKPTIQSMLAYCDLPWDAQCLKFHKTRRAVKTASVWQVREPIHKQSVARWRNYQKYLDPLIEALGEHAPPD